MNADSARTVGGCDLRRGKVICNWSFMNTDDSARRTVDGSDLRLGKVMNSLRYMNSDSTRTVGGCNMWDGRVISNSFFAAVTFPFAAKIFPVRVLEKYA